jgi:RNA polymerase sigma factor (sigma-70 family)
MTEPDDHQLLTEFARNNSETAFAKLVQRHINLVYSTALRSVGNSHAAEEITQAVFIILARKADGLSRNIVLSGWLYQTARLMAANYLRTEIRRQQREQEAYMQSTLNEPESEAWRQIAPLLDDAIAKLGEKDRNALVLRFFENKNLSEVGAALGASEDAAKMRVNRALEKLHRFFNKHGISSTTAILAGEISAHSVQAAPAMLAKSVTVVAIAKGAAASASTLTLIKGALNIMAWTKAKTTVVVGVGILLVAGSAMIIVKEVRSPDWNLDLNSQTLDQMPTMLVLRPTKMPTNWVPGGMFGNNRYFARGQTAKELITTIYSQKNSEAKLVFLAPLPDDKFDCVVTGQTNWPDALEYEINRRFNLVEQWDSQAGGTVVVVKKAN